MSALGVGPARVLRTPKRRAAAGQPRSSTSRVETILLLRVVGLATVGSLPRGAQHREEHAPWRRWSTRMPTVARRHRIVDRARSVATTKRKSRSQSGAKGIALQSRPAPSKSARRRTARTGHRGPTGGGRNGTSRIHGQPFERVVSDARTGHRVAIGRGRQERHLEDAIGAGRPRVAGQRKVGRRATSRWRSEERRLCGCPRRVRPARSRTRGIGNQARPQA